LADATVFVQPTDRVLVMTKRLFPVLLFGVALTIAACGSSSSSSTSTTAKATTTTQATTTTVAKLATCTTKNLAISTPGSQGAAGSVYVPVVFQNIGTTTCTLGGFPGVAGTSASGGQQTQATRTSANPTTITLTPNAFASSMVKGSDVPSGSATSCPPNYAGLLVTPPNDTQSQALTVSIPSCAGLTVSPVVAGSNGQ
jgi:hypothetical protein